MFQTRTGTILFSGSLVDIGIKQKQGNMDGLQHNRVYILGTLERVMDRILMGWFGM